MKIDKLTTEQMELLIYEYLEKSSIVVVPRFNPMNGCRYKDETAVWGTRYETIVNHECDILSVSKKMYLREVEIKISVSDFKADLLKKHQHIDKNIRQFYYAIPYYILDNVKDLVPENAGILVAKIIEKTNRNNEITSKKWIIEKIKSPKNNNLAKPIDDKKLNVIFRIGYLKYWFHRKRKEKKGKTKGVVELKKILYIDTETGGVDFQKSALIQLSGIVEIDGVEQERFNFYVKPFVNSEITEEALQVQGRTFADLATDKYIDEKIVYRDFVAILDKYIDKYDKTDKFLVAGFNVNFDINMIKALFLRNHNSFLYSYIESASFVLDPMQIVTFLQEAQVLPKLENNKLGTLCEYFNIKFEAHDSMEDIIATKALIKVLLEKLSRCRG